MFFASGSKNHGICNVFWPGPSKNTGIYVVFSMLQERFFSCQKQKNTVNYIQYFRAWQAAKKWLKIATKCPKWTSETHLEILAWSKMSQNYPTCHFYAFSSSDIKKTSKNYENTTSIWTRCQNFVSVRNRFWAPPPAKADIATAILTNVIEHLVLLIAPQ